MKAANPVTYSCEVCDSPSTDCHQKWITGSIYTIVFLCMPCSKVTSLVSVATFLRPCVSLEWHFGAIGWSWFSCIGAWRASQCLLSSIRSTVCTKKGPVGPQTGPLGFNYLHIPFCTPILSPPFTQHLYYCHVQYRYLHKKSCS